MAAAAEAAAEAAEAEPSGALAGAASSTSGAEAWVTLGSTGLTVDSPSVSAVFGSEAVMPSDEGPVAGSSGRSGCRLRGVFRLAIAPHLWCLDAPQSLRHGWRLAMGRWSPGRLGVGLDRCGNGWLGLDWGRCNAVPIQTAHDDWGTRFARYQEAAGDTVGTGDVAGDPDGAPAAGEPEVDTEGRGLGLGDGAAAGAPFGQ